MPSLVQQVKGRLSIHVRRRSLALLEGGYASIHKGRSMDFDDLREYAVGDDIRDIDWKASARHGSMLIKRYVAERHFSLIIVMPAGREMAATAAGGEPKRDIAVLAAGVLGWLAVRHGDDQWFDIVKWAHFAMLNAEELGVTKANVDDMAKSDNPDIKRLLGTEGKFGEGLGLTNDWAVRIIKQVGNYGEIFEKNVGQGSPLKIARGLNALWNKGGLQYAPPVR